MEDRPVGSILVNNRTIDIAGEVLAIRQIVRLKELEYVRKNGFSTGRTLMIVGALAVAFFSRSMFPSYAYSSSDTGSTVSVVSLLVALGTLLYSLYSTRRYILAIELASGGFTGLSARNPQALTDLKETIAGIIENPPTQATPVSIHGDVYAVDARGSKNSQFGGSNFQQNF